MLGWGNASRDCRLRGPRSRTIMAKSRIAYPLQTIGIHTAHRASNVPCQQPPVAPTPKIAVSPVASILADLSQPIPPRHEVPGSLARPESNPDFSQRLSSNGPCHIGVLRPPLTVPGHRSGRPSVATTRPTHPQPIRSRRCRLRMMKRRWARMERISRRQVRVCRRHFRRCLHPRRVGRHDDGHAFSCDARPFPRM